PDHRPAPGEARERPHREPSPVAVTEAHPSVPRPAVPAGPAHLLEHFSCSSGAHAIACAVTIYRNSADVNSAQPTLAAAGGAGTDGASRPPDTRARRLDTPWGYGDPPGER